MATLHESPPFASPSHVTGVVVCPFDPLPITTHANTAAMPVRVETMRSKVATGSLDAMRVSVAMCNL